VIAGNDELVLVRQCIEKLTETIQLSVSEERLNATKTHLFVIFFDTIVASVNKHISIEQARRECLVMAMRV
jgi:hypothetical protein